MLATRQSFREHCRQHTGECYVCDLCGQKFTTNSGFCKPVLILVIVVVVVVEVVVVEVVVVVIVVSGHNHTSYNAFENALSMTSVDKSSPPTAGSCKYY